MEYNNQTKIAILIDAENISYKNTQQIIDTMEKKGKILVKMVVADWTKITGAQTKTNGKFVYRTKQIEGWRAEASRHSMTAIQQFSYVSGKNTSDIALTIQAMKILY
ncbi:MAG: NYN domain-containing protein [Clostridia bacterium]|nr:NYN domain-containing protein [Clostridia bacterium]